MEWGSVSIVWNGTNIDNDLRKQQVNIKPIAMCVKKILMLQKWVKEF